MPKVLSEGTRITEGGRIVIPAEYRRALGVGIGDTVMLELKDGELHVFTLRRAIERAQEIVRHYVADDRSLAQELIAERREEAARE